MHGVGWVAHITIIYESVCVYIYMCGNQRKKVNDKQHFVPQAPARNSESCSETNVYNHSGFIFRPDHRFHQ
jgi:hypothetical protein